MELPFLIFGLFLLGIGEVVESSDAKSSLTFVIDNTGSMSNDIEQVKMGANAIFDTVMNSNASQIEDIVLVTFKDPDTSLRTITKDRTVFKNKLKEIEVAGGGDCPEMSMSGIKLALEKSREGSVLYVFTDASAKDFKKYDEVEALSQKMGSQIVFVLTGVCGSRRDPDYLVYKKIATATNGQVFHLQRREIGEILKYVQNAIESRKNIIASKTFPSGNGKFDVVVDGDTKEIVIAVSGLRPSVVVTDSSGTKWPTTDITKLREIEIVKVVGVKPDVYSVAVGGKSETHVVVSGSTSVHFQHGFSVITPSTIADTVKRPVPGEMSHLSIKLTSDGGNVVLHRVQILDMTDHVILEKPLTLVDKTEQFYTTDLITPPGHLFKIAIIGEDLKTKTYLTRISLTPVKPQDIKPHTVKAKAPVVSIEGSPEITAKYDESLQLKCKISGYPKPSVIWQSDDDPAVLTYTVSTVELPYDYVSVLDLHNIRKNYTYRCKALNSEGRAEIRIQTKINNFFNVLTVPEDVTIEYQKQHKIPCKADASPPAIVSWYKDLRPLRLDENMELSDDGSVLTIRSMKPYAVGDYICEMRNSVGRKVVPFKIAISGVEPPEIRKDEDIKAMVNSRVNIECRIIKGHPKPVISWLYKGTDDKIFTTLSETTETVHFDSVKSKDAGSYRCVAENDIGLDFNEIELVVEYKPSISRKLNRNQIVNQGDTVTMACPADGVPTPEATWMHNGAPIRDSRHSFFRDGSLRFLATSWDKGEYECQARNTHGVDIIRMELDVIVPVDIESPKNSSIEEMVGFPVALPCRADGSPKPEITWVFRSDDKTRSRKILPSDATGELRFPMIQPMHSGEYTCVATNSGGSKNITYEVSVLAPPDIRYKKKQFRGVIEDMQLRIPCDATGNPKPEITWSNNGYMLAAGSEWYDIDEDGSLIIKNLDKLSEGFYKCSASNKFGKKEEDFHVAVDEYPDPSFLSKSEALEEGTSAVIPCSVPQKRTDRLRWFKDGRIVSNSTLELRNVRQSDSGTYTCRVSFVDRPARSGSTKVEVGFKPQFLYGDDEKNIQFEKETIALMDCLAIGHPAPEVKWYHDGKDITFTEFRYEFAMNKISDRGRYTCEVSNIFGTARQDFFIASFECLLDIKNDFNDNEPLMLTTSDELPLFENSDGYLHIPKDEMLKLVCPSGFRTTSDTEITVTCENERQFKVQPSGISYAFSDLKCRYKLQPTVKPTRNRCAFGDSEMMNVGFDINGRFKEVYQICLDKASRNPIYTKLNMQQSLANVVANNNTEWFNSGSPVDLDSLYDCNYQKRGISSTLDKDFHPYDGCCFAKRMLVNPKDVAPGLTQAATFTHLNVAPQWSTCNSKNWEDVEQRIRDLAVMSDRPLQVWTGTAQNLMLLDARSEPKNLILYGRGKDSQVPTYFWKVVQDDYTNASLAIIQVNVPDLNIVESRRYRLCTDVCQSTEWMQSRQWRSVNRGYTYCCSLENFVSAFRYYDIFPPKNNLLKRIDYIPDSHYLHVI